VIGLARLRRAALGDLPCLVLLAAVSFFSNRDPRSRLDIGLHDESTYLVAGALLDSRGFPDASRAPSR
jgi:hypothetical protein